MEGDNYIILALIAKIYKSYIGTVVNKRITHQEKAKIAA